MGLVEGCYLSTDVKEVRSVKTQTIVIITRASTCLELTPFGKEPQKVLTLEFEQQSQICQPKLLMTQNNKALSHFPGSTPCFFPLPKHFFQTCKQEFKRRTFLHKTEIYPTQRPILKQYHRFQLFLQHVLPVPEHCTSSHFLSVNIQKLLTVNKTVNDLKAGPET